MTINSEQQVDEIVRQVDEIVRRFNEIRLKLSETEQAQRSHELYWSFLEGWCDRVLADRHASEQDMATYAQVRAILDTRHEAARPRT